jgi:hypothetical protein
MPWQGPTTVATLSSARGWKKLNKPEPEFNLAGEANSGLQQQTPA